MCITWIGRGNWKNRERETVAEAGAGTGTGTGTGTGMESAREQPHGSTETKSASAGCNTVAMDGSQRSNAVQIDSNSDEDVILKQPRLSE